MLCQVYINTHMQRKRVVDHVNGYKKNEVSRSCDQNKQDQPRREQALNPSIRPGNNLRAMN